MRLEVVLGVGIGVVSFVGLVRFRLDVEVVGSAVFRFRLFFAGVGIGGRPGSWKRVKGSDIENMKKEERG